MSENGILEDSRFSKVFSDPKFKKPPKHERKVRIDKRFQSMFTNDAFRVKYSVDKRGRRISKSTTEDFKRFYDLSSDEENDSAVDKGDSDAASKSAEDTSDEADNEITDSKLEEKSKKVKKLSKKQKKHYGTDGVAFPSLNDEEREIIQKKQISRSVRKKLKDMNVDYARGEGRLFSESSSDESESEESETEIYHEWNELDKDADTTDNITNRLAICNMDWDRVRAVDLMVLFNSFLPAEGLIHSVVIYPSDFGLKRMAEEEVKGPAELVNDHVDNSSDSDSGTEAEEGKQFNMERMRQYQLNRLKYYYAVATFDSPKTADIIYTNCNGVEYESSGIRLDLRFIDDDVTFDQEPKDSCDNPNCVEKYEPLYFTNTALQQAKVELTWDETDPRRLECARRITEAAKTQDINDSDLENLVALSSSGEEDDEREGTLESTMSDTASVGESEVSEQGDPIEVYRNLLKEIEENEKDDRSEDDDAELEITWGADSGSNSEKTTKISKKSERDDEVLTPFERIIEKKKEKAKARRAMKLQKNKNTEEAEGNNDEDQNKMEQKKKSKKPVTDEEDEKQKKELELLLLDEAEDNKHHFSLKKIKENEKLSKKKRKFKKKKKENKPVEEDDFQVDVNDERFSALYASHLFNIDPTDPKFHKTKGMEAFVNEKQKRLSQKESSVSIPDDEPATKKMKDAELTSLVKSLKTKSRTLLPKNKMNKRKL